MERHLGREFKELSNHLDRKMTQILSSNGAEDVTPMHGMILVHLHFHRDQPVYQRDIEAEFHVSRSTVTSLLKLMEKKGFILRQSVAHDARLKQLRLTPLGEEAFRRIDTSIHQSEMQMKGALSPQELQSLYGLLDRIKAVL